VDEASPPSTGIIMSVTTTAMAAGSAATTSTARRCLSRRARVPGGFGGRAFRHVPDRGFVIHEEHGLPAPAASGRGVVSAAAAGAAPGVGR
jgi:hypothetical protein